MPRRKKGQSSDFVAGALKRMMMNKEGFTQGQLAWMYKAAFSLALLDGDETFTQTTTPEAQANISQVPAPAPDDSLLESLRAKHGGAA
jgi:hypothetical protein